MYAPSYALTAIPAPPRRLGDRFLTVLSWTLLGYALLGRGFAHLGVAPLYVGEATLALGLAALVGSGTLSGALRLPMTRLVAMIMVWGAVTTVPHLGTYGVDALRDAVLWGYGAFALIVAAVLIERPDRLRWLLLRYRGFVHLFVGLVWLFYLVGKVFGDALPSLPGSSVPVISVKAGDILVHLAGAGAFLLIGMARRRLPLMLLLGFAFAITMVSNRGGMLAFAAALMLVALLRPPGLRFAPYLFGALLLLTTVALINPSIDIDGNRKISMEQVWTNVQSIFGSSDARGLEGTREWRLMWWTKIVDYTVHGDYFWMGKGFGINLASDDGFQVTSDESLRSPHNGHLTMLARAGVPGFVLWLLLLGLWGTQMLRACLRCRRAGDHAWAGIFLFLLAYWSAFLINASFDVFLEGPMGGIWFWSLTGVGIAALHIHRTHPEVAWET